MKPPRPETIVIIKSLETDWQVYNNSDNNKKKKNKFNKISYLLILHFM